MAAIVDVAFENGCIEEVIKDRDLTPDDFPLGIVTPLVAYASWEFPEGVEPCLPVKVGQSVVYSRTSEGAGAAQCEGMDAVGFDGFNDACGRSRVLARRPGAASAAHAG